MFDEMGDAVVPARFIPGTAVYEESQGE